MMENQNVQVPTKSCYCLGCLFGNGLSLPADLTGSGCFEESLADINEIWRRN